MEGFLVSTGLVALAEIGDKTQLLAFVLAVKFRRPVAIVAGILVATLANHGIAVAFGTWLAVLTPPDALRWLLGLSFIAMAAWVLVPDDLDANDPQAGRHSAFAATLVAFFLVEMGDKTQFATVALAVEYILIVPVLAGTTLGMMIANTPVVYLGERCSRRVPMKLVRGVAAASFVLFGAVVLLGAGS